MGSSSRPAWNAMRREQGGCRRERSCFVRAWRAPPCSFISGDGGMFKKISDHDVRRGVSDSLRMQFLAGLFVGTVVGIGVGGLLGILV